MPEPSAARAPSPSLARLKMVGNMIEFIRPMASRLKPAMRPARIGRDQDQRHRARARRRPAPCRARQPQRRRADEAPDQRAAPIERHQLARRLLARGPAHGAAQDRARSASRSPLPRRHKGRSRARRRRSGAVSTGRSPQMIEAVLVAFALEAVAVEPDRAGDQRQRQPPVRDRPAPRLASRRRDRRRAPRRTSCDGRHLARRPRIRIEPT